MTMLPITLSAAGAAALLNIWLGVRIGRIRTKERISIGDGGNAMLMARMRAQLNFAEYVPVVLILIGLVELATGSPTWLWVVAGLFILGRLLQPFGMDGWMTGRLIAVATTMLTMLGLGAYALWLGLAPLLG